MGREAAAIGANSFQFFTRNPRGGSAKKIHPADVAACLAFAEENDFCGILAHAPYTLNACSADENTRRFAFEAMSDDLRRMEYTPGQMYNFHPGSHVGQGVQKGIELICELLNRVLKKEQTTTVLLETMAGKGSEIGSRFEELKAIIDGTMLADKLGVCFDTCHVFDAGYDIVKDLDGVLTQFDKVIGLNRLKAVHINDTMNPFSQHKDRHQKIGQGYIGVDAFSQIINHPALRKLPFYLETPNELEGYQAEIALLKSLYRE